MVSTKQPITKEEPQEEGLAPSPKGKQPHDVYHDYFMFSNPEDATKYLAGVLSLQDYESDPRSAARLDYVAYALKFALEAGYGPKRVHALISLANSILDATIAGASCAEVQATFQTKLLAATSPRPGADSELFSPDQVAHVAQYFARTFFRHFRLYSYLYSTPQDLAESTATLLVETAIVPSFENALAESEWLQVLEDKRLAEETAAAEARQAALVAKEAAAAKAAEEAAAKAEEQRQADLLRKPATLEDAIEHMVAVRLEAEKKILSDEYAIKEEEMLKRIAELELRAGPPNNAAAAKNKRAAQVASPTPS